MNEREHDHDTFKYDLEDAGFDVEHYRGRFMWEGPAVRCEDASDFQRAIRATAVRVQWDSLGRGWIVYPAARQKKREAA